MAPETNQDTFGSYLKGFRLERGLELRSLSSKTKIALHLIRAMEANDHDHLPPKPYVKGFIQTFAKAVGADPDTATGLYIAELEKKESSKQKALRREANLGNLRRLLLVSGLVTGILLLVRFTDFLPEKGPSLPAAVSKRTIPDTPMAGDRKANAPQATQKMPEESLRLQVTALKETWLKVIVDGTNARSYSLKPEDHLELEGSVSFNVMIGDATALAILLNDRPVQLYGSKGQTVSLKLP